MDSKGKEKIINETMKDWFTDEEKKNLETIPCPFCNTEIKYEDHPSVAVFRCQTENCFYRAYRGL